MNDVKPDIAYAVYDNGKPASRTGYPQITNINDWNTHRFSSIEDAVQYAHDWLGAWSLPLKVNEPYDYSGYGDFIEIKREL